MELNVTDPDIGDTHTFSTSLEPTNGTLQLDSTNGILVYSPNLNFNGSDSFEITVTDSAGTSDSILFHLSVTAVNDSSVIDSIEGLFVYHPEDTTLSYDLNGSDPDLPILCSGVFPCLSKWYRIHRSINRRLSVPAQS